MNVSTYRISKQLINNFKLVHFVAFVPISVSLSLSSLGLSFCLVCLLHIFPAANALIPPLAKQTSNRRVFIDCLYSFIIGIACSLLFYKIVQYEPFASVIPN